MQNETFMNRKIGIIGAMKIEIETLRELMKDTHSEIISGVEYTDGKLFGHDVVVAVCGVGKVFAACCAQTMILRYSVGAIINTGVGGSLSPELGICDIAVADSVVQHDMDTSPLGDPLGLISGINLVYIPASKELNALLCNSIEKNGIKYEIGIIASGDKFVFSDDSKQFIKNTFNGIACEMEGAAIGQVCYINNTPFSILRSISDSGNSMDYMEFVGVAANNSVEVLKDFFKNLK